MCTFFGNRIELTIEANVMDRYTRAAGMQIATLLIKAGHVIQKEVNPKCQLDFLTSCHRMLANELQTKLGDYVASAITHTALLEIEKEILRVTEELNAPLAPPQNRL